jgi:hypothetical protein
MGTQAITQKEPSCCTKVCQSGIEVTVGVVSKVEGWKQISDLALVVFAFMEHVWRVVTPTLTTFGTCLSTMLDLASIIDVMKRVKNWACPDEDGQMLWQKAWQNIAAMSCVTAHHALNFITFLGTTLKVFNLGAALLPVSILNHLSNAGYGVFDVWTTKIKINETNNKIDKLAQAKEKWAARARMFAIAEKEIPREGLAKWTKLVGDQKAAWKDKVTVLKASGESAKLSQAMAKATQWTILQKAEVSDVKAFCNKKVELLDTKIVNEKKEKTKSWAAIAFDVALVALSVFAIVMACITPIWIATTIFLAVAFVTSGLELTGSFLDEILKPKELPTVDLPVV